MRRPILVGTRGSALSLKQADEVLQGLKRLHPDRAFEIRVITTHGDRDQRAPISRFGLKGIFIVEPERHLAEGAIDIAVHSLKDMPSENPPGFRIAAVTSRQDPRDVLITSDNRPLAELPQGSRLGSGSPRRATQIRAVRPDLEIADIRGNVDTRIEKVKRGEYHGAVLAAAGLVRMGWEDRITEYLSVDLCLPAVGQGALAVEVRADDEEAHRLVEGLDDPPTRSAVEAERALLRHMGGGCLAPITAYGCYENGALRLRGMVADPNTNEIIRAEVAGNGESPEELGAMLADKLVSLGAAELIETVKE
ncbi:MAG: hydroxymethylbilane synthase [Dehalococcoidia bacterium]